MSCRGLLVFFAVSAGLCGQISSPACPDACPTSAADLFIYLLGGERCIVRSAGSPAQTFTKPSRLLLSSPDWVGHALVKECPHIRYTYPDRDHGGVGNMLLLSSAWGNFQWTYGQLSYFSLHANWKGKTCLGIGIGSTLAEFKRAYGPAVLEQQSPREWFIRYRNDAQSPDEIVHLFTFDKKDRLERVSVSSGSTRERPNVKFRLITQDYCPY